MIHKITPSVDCNLWLNREDNQLNKPINQNSIKVVKPTNKKRFYKTLGSSVINSSISPPSLRKPIKNKHVKTIEDNYIHNYSTSN